MESQETAMEVQEPKFGIVEEDVIKAASGENFATERAAKGAMKQKNLNPSDYMPRRATDDEDGWVIFRLPKYKERYFKVRFSDRSNSNDPIDVELSVNGEKLVIARENEVIIPERFKICADHTKYQKFTQEPNQPRKIIGTIHVYPYTLIGEATEEQYLKAKAEGTRKTKLNIAKFGWEVTPSQVQE